MKLPKEFEYYIKKGIIRKISPDISRSKFLLEEAKNSLIGLNERIKIIGINNNNANSIIKDCYDIIMEIIRSRLLNIGYTASGQYSHEAEVSYLINLDYPEADIIFLNELRYFRNSITYYGKMLDHDYAKRVFKFTEKIIQRLLKI